MPTPSSAFASAALPVEHIRTRDGLRLALYRIGAAEGPAVILTHGTFSNYRSCLGLAEQLAERGFACWVFDWRGHGGSDRGEFRHSFDEVAEHDVPAVLDAVGQRSGQPAAFWIGHSGGGLIASMWAARNPRLAGERLRGLVLLGSQATAAGGTLRHRLLIHAYDLLLRGRRVAPQRRRSIGPEAESARLMRQWCQWNLRGRFDGLDGFDYLASLAEARLPVLGLAGSGDRFIAPAAGCQALVEAFGGDDADCRLCGKHSGFREDYSHNRLVLSRNASEELWPLIGDWMAPR
ncbi:alpha/beta fold hydrolase [Pseudomonas panipatensis]|jgi:oxygen-independent coproporphyrinogen-3 oxidase|uniref:Oxygen-independent coproporphyrinogen-3 oxidase n=1 Tax=Pseudomonas panipatensis TaxID=428992 RepID=A0A1G8HGP9_9PSED|nr:alpha/beta fold hydrolase [Pseudomonas panipatensis]SDI05836.1 oxygen-independent coproporphyrinogen-3 oxidase [Pseudomonas panipatensis]SMP58167.1 Serine aminopeptidase, S33 [Pseudomonas panipatensis]